MCKDRLLNLLICTKVFFNGLDVFLELLLIKQLKHVIEILFSYQKTSNAPNRNTLNIISKEKNHQTLEKSLLFPCP